MKRIVSVLLALIFVLGAVSCAEGTVNVAALNGPTGMGMVKMMKDEEGKEAYAFTLAGAPDMITPKLIKGELDIACVPANLASVLYNKTQGNIQVLAVNTLGVLYIVERGDSVSTIADLKGRTVYASGMGSTPEYALNYLLRENGLDPETDVDIQWKSEHSECLMALENPGVNLVAVDINSSVLGVAKRNAEFAFADRRAVDNLKLMNYEIELISHVFAPEDAVRRIYISFPNPWTQRHRQEKHRLTHTRLLNIYRGFMADGGEIWFKTDNDELFEASLSYFPQAGFEIKELTRDLHAEASHPNYISEHEKLFSSQGIPIKALIAVKR